jgi:hypothetical protein
MDVAEFVPAFAEVLHFNPAFVDEGFEAVVDAASTYAEFLGELPLRDVRRFLDEPHDSVVRGFALGAEGGHCICVLVIWATALPCLVRNALGFGCFFVDRFQGERW